MELGKKLWRRRGREREVRLGMRLEINGIQNLEQLHWGQFDGFAFDFSEISVLL